MPRTVVTPKPPTPLVPTALDSNDGQTQAGRRSVRGGLITALLALTLLVLTEPFLAIGWDEGYSLGRERRIRTWLSALADPEGFAESWSPPRVELVQPDGPPPPGTPPVLPPTREQVNSRGALFAPEVIAYFWPFAREEPHGHPPFYAVVGLAGDLLTPWREELPRARFGPMLVFSLAVGALFTFLDRRNGRWAAAVGASALMLQPRLFGHAHYAAYDALLTALWVLAVLAFFKAVEQTDRRSPSWGWSVVLGLVIGCAAATKLTGWFVPLPMIAWLLVFRDRRALLALLAAAPVALATIYAFVPPWWHDPMGGFLRFLASNTGRGKTIPIEVMYLGTVYRTPVESLPPENSVVWTALVTPIGFLGLAVLCVLRTIVAHGRERFGTLVVLNWLFLLGLRALPNVPGHDGIRLFLPAFGMLAMASGLGAAMVVNRLGRWGEGIALAALLEGLVSVAVMMPVPLSYFSPAVGGLPGATRLGMEPTYYWDSMTDEVLDWLDANTPPDRRVATATFPTSFFYLNESGRLSASILPRQIDPRPPAWFVIQNRPGALGQIERDLIRTAEPAFVSQKFGVPLLWVFRIEEVEALQQRGSRRASEPSYRGPGLHRETNLVDPRVLDHE